MINTFASDGATRAIRSRTCRIGGDSAIKLGGAPGGCLVLASSFTLSRSASANSICVRTTLSRRSLSHGFGTKSRAPRFIASTATSTVDHAVMTIIGNAGLMAWISRDGVETFLAGRCVAGVVQVHHDKRVIALLDRAEKLGRRAGTIGVVAGAFKQHAQRYEHVVLIVGDEDSAHVRCDPPIIPGATRCETRL